MQAFPPSFQRLVHELSRLPSIGEKSATRLAYFILRQEGDLGAKLASAIQQACSQIRLCETCFFLSESEKCRFCSDPGRDEHLICVVEKPMDIIAFERMGEFRGLYHVLHGLWAPLRGQGPESMKLRELLERVEKGEIEEVILATSSTVEGDATALYIAKLLSERGIVSSRLAQGIPKGGELEYSDEVTLSRALSGRSRIDS
ncbi:MAG: recombination protein RecR [Bdellovibrionales bacterium]|nr:recombination protein RecR [Bdellovibrionales bacterium]